MTYRSQGGHALAILLTTALCLGGAAAARAQQADADFEAAVKSAAPTTSGKPATSAGGKNRYVGLAHGERPEAPRGTIPARWRTMTEVPWNPGDADADLREGRLNGTSLVEQMSAPLVVPPDAMPVSCGRSLGRVSYTMGADLTPEYAALAAKGRNNSADPLDVEDKAATDAEPVRERVRSFFVQHGFREFRKYRQRAGFFDPKRKLRIEVENSSASMRRYCLDLPTPITLPTGPLLHYMARAELGPDETFVDEKPAPAGKRVTHPFG
jgi:hypothetical protein